MPASQQLKDFFDELSSTDVIESLVVATGMSETNYLEFKEKSDARIPDLGDADRVNFSRVVSAFSNADGGLLIWGIKSKNKGEGDFAAKSIPIVDATIFAERLRSSLLNTIMPHNHSIEVKPVVDDTGAGFVLCLIGPADNAPVRSMVGDREYWVRMANGSARMEHYQIRDMMLRRALPDLEMGVVQSTRTVQAGQAGIDFVLTNVGRAIAKHVGMFVQITGASVCSAVGLGDASHLNPGLSAASFNGDISFVVHPVDIRQWVGTLVVDQIHEDRVVTFDVQWYCEGQAPKRSTQKLRL